jgi:hypothetical protein
MGKTIRPTYPLEISIGLLLLIFVLSLFLSGQVFETQKGETVYFGMTLVSLAVIIMVLILWEEFLFPVKATPVEGGLLFRNHRTKLKIQVLFYFTIPLIFAYIYFNYEVNLIRFIIWAGICMIIPIVGKLFSGINNYNDFLKLTKDKIEYKNNEKTGAYNLQELYRIHLVKDERNVLHKIQLTTNGDQQVLIDLDEMELDAFFEVILKFVQENYKTLLANQ